MTIDNSWMEALVSGDCIDGKAPSGDWEIAIIDEISPTGTEISVTWSTGVHEWVSLDSGRVAQFNTKSGVDLSEIDTPDPLPTPHSNTSVGATGTAISEGVQNALLITAESRIWRGGLKAGDLIDARDKSGFWYQVAYIRYLYLFPLKTNMLHPGLCYGNCDR